MVSQVHYSSGKDNWGTPPRLFEQAQCIWDFKLDVCAEPWSAKCDSFYTKRDNGLLLRWKSWSWCNPPYSQIEAWLEKAALERHHGASSVMLIPSRTDTKAFHRYAPQASRIFLVKGRLRFIDPETEKERDYAPFPSMLIEFDSKYTGTKPSVEFMSLTNSNPNQPTLLEALA